MTQTSLVTIALNGEDKDWKSQVQLDQNDRNDETVKKNGDNTIVVMKQ